MKHFDESAGGPAPGRGASLDTRLIFRRMIEDEVRAGRLTRSRRRRIVRYAAQLDLSAVETGRLIDECRAKVAAERRADVGTDDRSAADAFTYHDSTEGPPGPAMVWKIWLIVVAAIVLDLLMLRWLAG